MSFIVVVAVVVVVKMKNQGYAKNKTPLLYEMWKDSIHTNVEPIHKTENIEDWKSLVVDVCARPEK